MPLRFAALLAAAGLSLAPPPAAAIVLPVAATLELEFFAGSTPGAIPPIVLSGAGVAVANGAGGGGHLDTLSLPARLFDADGWVVPVSDPGAYPISGFQLTASNGVGVFGSGGGTMPLAGVTKVCLYGPCDAAVTNLTIPLGVVGVTGFATAAGAIDATVFGAPWTTGTATLYTGGGTEITRMGYARGPAGLTSSTAAASGSVRLVTPIFISTNLGQPLLPSFGILTLDFVPEPGTLLLLGAGVAVLAAAGRSHRSH